MCGQSSLVVFTILIAQAMVGYQEYNDMFRLEVSDVVLQAINRASLRARVTMVEIVLSNAVAKPAVDKMELHKTCKAQMQTLKKIDGAVAVLQTALRDRANLAIAFK